MWRIWNCNRLVLVRSRYQIYSFLGVASHIGTAVLASISTSLAEILGGAIALQMLFDIPIIWGSILTTVFVVVMLFTNSYKKIERSIIAFVSVIGLSFIYELFLVKIDWPLAAQGG